MTHDPLDSESDPFKPPAIPTVVGCLHCHQEYDSYLIEWRVETDADGKSHGFWCCPTPGCGGRGFCFDIFPVDPDWRDEDGNKVWVSDDEEDEEEGDDDEYLEEDDVDATLDDTDKPSNDDSGKRPRDNDEEIPF